MREPKIGEKLYIGNSMSISHGSEDVAGGLATIAEIEWSKSLPKDHINACFVEMKEVPGTAYNYNLLLKDQEKLSKRFTGKVAHPDPDIDTPWIESGDIVNGKEWLGSSIW